MKLLWVCRKFELARVWDFKGKFTAIVWSKYAQVNPAICIILVRAGKLQPTESSSYRRKLPRFFCSLRKMWLQQKKNICQTLLHQLFTLVCTNTTIYNISSKNAGLRGACCFNELADSRCSHETPFKCSKFYAFNPSASLGMRASVA